MGEKKPVKTAKRPASADEMIFEVWQVITPISPDDEFDGFNHWPPFSITEPEKNLSEVCAKKYGPGDFVALHLAESRMGLPLSHWVIKVRSLELHHSLPVHPDAECLSIVREQTKKYRLAGHVAAELFYRREEAAVTSLCLQELEEPKAKESKETAQVTYARSLLAPMPRPILKKDRDKIIEQIIDKNKTEKWWDPSLSEEAQQVFANQTYKSAGKAIERAKSGSGIQKPRKLIGIRSKKK